MYVGQDLVTHGLGCLRKSATNSDVARIARAERDGSATPMLHQRTREWMAHQIQRTKLEIPFGHAFDRREISSPKSAVRACVRPVWDQPS